MPLHEDEMDHDPGDLKNIEILKTIYQILPEQAGANKRICLATLVATSGSAPQTAGSSALFSEQGLLAGTLGGGVMEGDAQKRAIEALRTGKCRLYDFQLDADINDREGAICGGSAKILLDPDPGMHLGRFREMTGSLEKGQPGCMITLISDRDDTPIRRWWVEINPENTMSPPGAPTDYRPGNKSGKALHALAGPWSGQWTDTEKAIFAAMSNGKCTTLPNESGDLLFIEPVFPLPKLVIAGAGHVGKALTHLASLLDFEVTVIDDRPDLANPANLPDADHVIVQPVGKAISHLPHLKDTFIVIVTRGHQDDAEALKACIGHDLPYIGMIGSRRKIRSMKEKFIAEGWASREAFERVHAPVGLEIGSVTVQEIALSIAAQLVQQRAKTGKGKRREQIASIILAAGESRRMGKPKMLLPFGDTTIIRTVIRNAKNATGDHVRVVLGANAEAIRENITDLEVDQVLNSEFRDGMLSSVQAGIRALPQGITAVMVLLGDQPMIPSEIMDRLIQRYKQSEKNIIIATAGGKRGHPMIFSAIYIPEILAFKPGDTMRDLISGHPGEVEEMETSKPEILRDIDTPQDYKNEIKNESL